MDRRRVPEYDFKACHAAHGYSCLHLHSLPGLLAWATVGGNVPRYGTNPMLNDLIVAVDFDKTILAFIPVKFEGNISLLTWKIAGTPTAVLFVPSRTT